MTYLISQAAKDFRKVSEANDQLCYRAWYRGRNHAFNDDGFDAAAYSEKEAMEWYADGYSLARADMGLDADREWG